MKLKSLYLVLILFASCDTSGVKTDKNKEVKKIERKGNVLDQEHKVIDKLKMPEGISIEWYEKGSEDKLVEGDLIQIDYKVKLKDGSIVDGNHLITPKKESIPFMVGFGMQPAGWDIALKEMRVGDFARILIPSKLARGTKGIEGHIPSNADNYLIIRIIKKEKPTRVVDGTKVWIIEENEKNKLKFGENTQITFHAMANSPSHPMYVNTFRTNQPFTFKLTDYGLVPGLKKALINAKKADRMFILVPASEAYGTAGYLDLVGPNENVFYNILVMDVAKI